jgi:4-carboxymuconolactone decarboxylase
VLLPPHHQKICGLYRHCRTGHSPLPLRVSQVLCSLHNDRRRVYEFDGAALISSGRLANHSNEEDMERREAGEKIMREMMGDETAERLLASAGSGTFGSAVAGYAIDQAFGEIWIRPGLDRKARSLVSMAVMIALRQPHEFATHMNIGLNNGLTLGEIEEALIQTLPYVGFPAVATALAAAGKVIQERGLDKNPAYGGHRGLL